MVCISGTGRFTCLRTRGNRQESRKQAHRHRPCDTDAAAFAALTDLPRLMLNVCVEAVDGPIALTSCAGNDVNDCVMEGHCAIRGHWAPINQAVRGALAAVTLADLVRPAAAAAPIAAPAPALAD